MDQEQVARMLDERIRDLASKGETDIARAAKIAELETSVKFAAGAYIDFRKDIAEGFNGIHRRLDKLNGTGADHEKRLTAIESTWGILKMFVPILGAIAAALIIAQLTGGP